MTAAASLAAGNLDVDIDRVDNCVCSLRLRGFRSAHRLLHLGEVDILAKDRDTVCLCVFKNPMVRAKLRKHRFAVFTALDQVSISPTAWVTTTIVIALPPDFIERTLERRGRLQAHIEKRPPNLSLRLRRSSAWLYGSWTSPSSITTGSITQNGRPPACLDGARRSSPSCITTPSAPAHISKFRAGKSWRSASNLKFEPGTTDGWIWEWGVL